MGIVSLRTGQFGAVVPPPHGVDHGGKHGATQVLSARAHGRHHRPFVEFGVVTFHCKDIEIKRKNKHIEIKAKSKDIEIRAKSK